MKILCVVNGEYGERKHRIFKEKGSPHWTVEKYAAPKALPLIIDEPEEILPANIPSCDLLISLGENPGVQELIPDIVKMTGAKSVIAPIDNALWLPKGLMNQIQEKLAEMEIFSVFPKPFCSMTETGDTYIDEFLKFFGRPELKLTLSKFSLEEKTTAGERIEKVEVLRSAPCGSTFYVAEKLTGAKVDDAVEIAGLAHHHYPCLASMDIDEDFHDTIMHRAGFILQDEVKKQLKIASSLSSSQ